MGNAGGYNFCLSEHRTVGKHKISRLLPSQTSPDPKCGTKIKYENYPGNRVTMVCSTCGSIESVSLEKTSKQPRTRLFFSPPNKKQ